jgi:hypothetical protein
MKPRIPDTHAEAWALLPWLANGRIGQPDREWVEAHVQSCAECRAELASQRELATRMNLAGSAASPTEAEDEQQSFDKLWARVEASEAASLGSSGSGQMLAGGRSSRTVRWLAAAVVVQAIGLGILGTAALRGAHPVAGESPDRFTTVARAEPARIAPTLRIVFAPEASVGTINTLLAHQGLTIVAGPGKSGNYTAELSADAVASGASAESVAAVISKDPNVDFAQPVAR